MRAYVAVTDTRWYEFLASHPGVSEVNFWRPAGGSAFRALRAGEPFIFKTRYPDNRIVGGGFFSGFTRLKLSEAWEFFGSGNGTSDEATLVESIRRYRHGSTDGSSEIGCVLLRDVRFFDPVDQLAAPADFARNLVQGRLRSDVHILFDRGYLGIDRRHRLRVSPRLRSEFGNGESFYERAGQQIALPPERRNRPAPEFLEWHGDTVFLD